MNCFRYKLDHDYGFAPNPFHGTLTLATCKAQIRSNPHLNIGDWVIGLGSQRLGCLGHLIYAMKVTHKMTFDQYWEDARFLCKRPNLTGSLVQMYGDNVYHTDPQSGRVIQENCAHSKEGGIPNDGHLRSDSSGKNVLLSDHFYYLGDHHVPIPDQFDYIYRNVLRNYTFLDLQNRQEDLNAFINWIETTFPMGISGDPINWSLEHQLGEMPIYEE